MVRVQKLMLFLPRDAIARSLLSSDVRRRDGQTNGSVRLSITFVHCIQTAEDIVKHLSRPGSPIILILLTLSADIKFLRLGRKIHGVGKICDFRQKSPSVSETIKDRPTDAMER